ncbi:MAG: hypothetical protein Q9159_007443, partial [Coniocarpon cinnabarinum]
KRKRDNEGPADRPPPKVKKVRHLPEDRRHLVTFAIKRIFDEEMAPINQQEREPTCLCGFYYKPHTALEHYGEPGPEPEPEPASLPAEEKQGTKRKRGDEAEEPESMPSTRKIPRIESPKPLPEVDKTIQIRRIRLLARTPPPQHLAALAGIAAQKWNLVQKRKWEEAERRIDAAWAHPSQFGDVSTKVDFDYGDKEFTGTLQGFDDFVNMVLSDVTEYDYSGGPPAKMKKILLNGNNVCMLIPGGEGPMANGGR